MWRLAICAVVAALALSLSSWGQAGGDKAGDGKTTKIEGEIKSTDAPDDNRKNPSKVHEFKMTKGQAVVIHLNSKDFDAFLVLQDSGKKQLAFNDDDPDKNQTDNSMLVFTADKDDTYRIIATSMNGQVGKYELTIDPASEKDKAKELSRLQHEFNQILLDFATVARQVDMKVKQAKTEAEKDKVRNQFYEFAAEHTIRVNAFADAHANDPAGKMAMRQAIIFVMELGTLESPGVVKHLKTLGEKAKSKDVRGFVTVALAENLIKQSAAAYRKKDKVLFNKLTGEATSLLELAVDKYGDVPTPYGPLADKAKDSLFLLTKLGLGKTAPDMEGELIDGKKFKLSDFRGKVTVVYFWGSWCPPCVQMIPRERDLAKKLASEPFAFVGINTDDNKESAQAFLTKKEITWAQVWAQGKDGPLPTAWKVVGYPTLYILDAKGVIQASFVGMPGPEFDEIVEALVAEAKK